MIALGIVIGYFQNKVAEVNEKNKTLTSQKNASDNDTLRYRQDLKEYLDGDLDGPSAADILDRLRNS